MLIPLGSGVEHAQPTLHPPHPREDGAGSTVKNMFSCCFLATWDFYRVSVVSPLCLFPVFSSLHSPKGLLVCFALDTTHMAVHCSRHGIHCMVLNTCDQQMAAMYHTTSLQGTGGQEFWLILSLLLLDISQQRCLESRQTTSRAQK